LQPGWRMNADVDQFNLCGLGTFDSEMEGLAR